MDSRPGRERVYKFQVVSAWGVTATVTATGLRKSSGLQGSIINQDVTSVPSHTLILQAALWSPLLCNVTLDVTGRGKDKKNEWIPQITCDNQPPLQLLTAQALWGSPNAGGHAGHSPETTPTQVRVQVQDWGKASSWTASGAGTLFSGPMWEA